MGLWHDAVREVSTGEESNVRAQNLPLCSTNAFESAAERSLSLLRLVLWAQQVLPASQDEFLHIAQTTAPFLARPLRTRT